MPERKMVAKELADIFKVMAHPDRIRIIQELGAEEKNVKTLTNELDLPGPRVSQHLTILRAYRIVGDRRDGRQHHYRLTQPQLANWILHAIEFIEGRLDIDSKLAISNVRKLWSTQQAK